MSPRIIQLPLSGRDRRHYVRELRAAEQTHRDLPAKVEEAYRAAHARRDRLRAVFLFDRNAYRWRTQEVLMEKLLLVAALACQPGDRLIDLSGKLPRGLQFVDLVVSVEPFYTRFYIYQLGFPQSRQQCAAATNRLRFYAYQSAQVVFA
jgi:hypothetical protein